MRTLLTEVQDRLYHVLIALITLTHVLITQNHLLVQKHGVQVQVLRYAPSAMLRAGENCRKVPRMTAEMTIGTVLAVNLETPAIHHTHNLATRIIGQLCRNVRQHLVKHSARLRVLR